jgi:hypothetical protein
MGIRDSIVTVLQADSTLMAFLTGGVHAATEISRQNTPTAFDANAEIKPCALVKVPNENEIPPHPYGAVTTLEVYFYQRVGFDVIEAAMLRVLSLLNRVKVGDHVWQIRWSDNLPEVEDEALKCSMGLSRFHVYRGLYWGE